MASTIILSDNGVSSGSAGIKTTGGNDGTLLLQTTTSGGTATTAIAVDTSQNVGIGTSSPIDKLQIVGGVTSTSLSAPTNTSIGSVQFGYDGTNGVLRTWNSSPLRFDTSGVQRLLIDTSGNLGLGVTSSGWTGGPATQFKYGGSVWNNNDSSFHFSENAYFNGSWNYISGSSAQATNYFQANGAHTWRYAASGTGALTWTTGMTLDASGRLQVAPSTGTGMVAVGDTAGGGTYNCGMYRGAAASVGSGDYLNVGGYSGIVFTTGSAALGSQTERARIDSSGKFLLGASSIPSAFAAALQYMEGSTSTYNLLTIKDTGTSYSTGNYYALFGNSTNGTAGSIAHNAAGTVAFQTSSDQRLKENIADAPAALEKVKAIKVRSYDWKEDQLHVDYGFIAQELYELVPEAVGKGDDAEELLNPRGTWQVEYGRLTPLLLKAIQEQQAMIQTLTERITALEGAQA